MCDSQRAHQLLLLEVLKTFAEIGVHGERNSGFGHFRIFSRRERFGSGFGGLGIFAIFLMIARRNIAAANLVQTIGGDKIGQAVDRQDSGNARAIVSKTDEGSRDKQAALYADPSTAALTGGNGELARRNHSRNSAH